MTLEAAAVVLVKRWRTEGFKIHVAIACLWCVSTTLGMGTWSRGAAATSNSPLYH